MKLHLPLSLRTSLLALFAAAVTCQTAQAGIMSSDYTLITYTDFGQNMGRYKTNDTANALLLHLRKEAGGVEIIGSDAQNKILLPNTMPDFSRTSGDASYAVYGYNSVLSVQHMNTMSGSMTSVHTLGNGNQIRYQGIEYATDGNETFLHSPGGGYTFAGQNTAKGVDHKVTRLSKIVTDVSSVDMFSGTASEMMNYLQSEGGQLLYRSGSGNQYIRNEAGELVQVSGSGQYITGGVDKADTGSIGSVYNGIGQVLTTTSGGSGSDEPLPFAGHAGDSGSPLYVWHDGKYEYVSNMAWTNHDNLSKSFSAIDYDREKLAAYDKLVETSATTGTIHIGAVTAAGESITSDKVATWSVDPSNVGSTSFSSISTTPYSGIVSDENGNMLAEFVGVKSGINTWKSLADVIDTDNWYHYGNEYLNADAYKTGNKELTYADLFVTENLVFRAKSEVTDIVLDATVDLGIGYARFSLSEGVEKAEFNISSGGTGTYQFNHAGYIIDSGVAVHTSLTGDAEHVYEWRKMGAGDLHIEGSGDNKILLNVGDSGKTYLEREGNSYAAYNVLANTGATVVLSGGINQIKRDFTFGNNGGVLDMHGHDMIWNNANGAEADGFTIHALDEQAVVANLKSNSETTLTWTQSGKHTFVGSFADNGTDSILKFVYDGGDGSSLTLNSIKTDLKSNGSGMIVNSGTLILSGTNTVHAKGSATGTNADRYFNENDWHYADATAHVTVNRDATFELGSHARLTGNVTVEDGGTFVMREGVKHAQEYIEGGQIKENTADIADFHGLKGNVVLKSGASMQVAYSAGTTALNEYGYSISGSGSLEINTASGILQLSGDNSLFTGTKTLTAGGLVAESAAALGDTSDNKWVIKKDGWLGFHGESGEELLQHIDTSSVGTLALSRDTDRQLDMSNHAGLYLGAEEGTVVQYGTAGTTEALQAVNGAWRLGGGGGTLVVNYLLTGANNLMLGASESSTGVVHLTNTNNSFSGSISFAGENVILTYADGALGNAMIRLSYANSLELGSVRELDLVDRSAEGMILTDKLHTADLDMSPFSSLSLGASESVVYSGQISLAENQAYRFGSLNGAVFTVDSALESGHDMIIDAQGSSGGKVVLSNIESFNGNLTLQGYRDTSASGQISLELTHDADFSKTVSVGTGTTLQGKNISVSSTSGSVELYGNLVYDSFTVSNGATLNLREGGRLDSNNAVTIAQGGIMRLNLQTLQDKVELKNGGIMYGNGGTIGADATVTATEGIGTISAATGTLTINGNVGAEQGATLILSGSHIKLYNSNVNTEGGILNIQASTLHMANINRIGGTLSIGADVTLQTDLCGRQGTPMQHNIDALDIQQGKSFTITQTAFTITQTASNDAHIWNIASITGSGTINWIASPYHHKYGTSRMLLSGENTFSGILRLETNYAWGSTYNAYLQHLELGSEGAARNMVIRLDSNSIQHPSVAVNTTNAHIIGINANAYSYLYSGAVSTNAEVKPTSTALNTLTINGADSYTFNGTVLGDSANGLSIVMNGTGSQTFTDSANVVHDITALRGALNFTNAPTIYGDVSIAQGATVQIGSAYSLDAGHTLHVLTGAEGGTATLNSSLVLNGGALDFGAYNADGSASLSVNGVSLGTSFGSSLTLSLSNTSGIQLDREYLLASGDWSAVNGKLTSGTQDFLSTVLTAGSNGLYATFSMKEGYTAWEGDNSELTANATVVFSKFSGADSVELSSNTTISTAYFDNADTFTVSSDNGSTLNAGSILKSSEGTLVLNTAVSADSMQVSGNGTISGSGSLSVGTLTAETDITTGMAINATNIQGKGNKWTMDGSERSFTQQMSAAQANTFSSLAVESMATLEISANEAATLSKGISGSGTVDKVGSGTLTATGAILVDNFRVSSGEFEAQGTVDIERLSVAGGAIATIYNASGDAGADKHLGMVELGKGAIFQTYDYAEVTKATSIGSMKLTGDAATLRDKNHSGYYHVGALSMDASVDRATLNIVKNAESSMSTVVELGEAEAAAGNFAGTIVLNSDTGNSGDDRRSLFLVLSGQESAAKAVVNLAAADSATAVLGLGVNADDTVIAGLESGSALGTRAKVFSGTVGTKTQWGSAANAPDGVGTTERTLHINTESGAEHNFHGEVMSHLNLIISGSGTQTFTGTSSGFNGSITVNGGTLALGVNAESMLTQASSVVVNEGGTLKLDTGTPDMEADIVSILSSVVMNEGSSLHLKADDTISPNILTPVNGSVALILEYEVSDNGSGFDLSRISGDITVASGRLQVNTSTFNEASDIYLSSSNAELVFNGTGTVLKNDVILGATNNIHVNAKCSGELAGTLSGQSLKKMGDGTLNISGTTNLAGLTVSGGTVNFKENASVSSLSVASGATLGIEADKTLTVTTTTAGITCNGSLSGTGTVEAAFTKDWGNNLQLGSSFAGTAYVKQGYVDLSDATPGATLRLADGVNANSAEKACTAAYDIVLEGESTIHANSGKNIVYKGTISGTNGVFASNGGGTHTFDGSVDLKGFQTDHNSNTTTFNKQTTLDTATISQATVNFNGETTIGTANISGGNTNFGNSAAATLSAVNQTGGTIKANGTVNMDGRFNGTGGTLALQSGEVNLSYAGDAGNSVYTLDLDGSIGGNAAGSLRLKENTKLNVGYQLQGSSQSSVVLEKDAALTHGSVQFSNRGTQEAKLETSSNDSQYSVGASDWSLTKGHLTADSDSEVTLGTQLVNSSVENAGSGLLTVSHASNNITDVYASAGDMAIMQQATGLNLDELVVAAGKMVSAYTGTSEKDSPEANVTVRVRAEFGEGAKLNANLTLASGSSLSVAEGELIMGSTLTLQQGITLDEATLNRVYSLKRGESVALFTWVDGLTLGETSYTSISSDDEILASPYFSNLNSDQYRLTYTGTDNGTLAIISVAVPEPTSSLLGLMGLVAFTLRRRRK